jgi:hypothetical protein
MHLILSPEAGIALKAVALAPEPLCLLRRSFAVDDLDGAKLALAVLLRVIFFKNHSRGV